MKVFEVFDTAKNLAGVASGVSPYTAIPALLWKYKYHIAIGLAVVSVLIYIAVLNYKISNRDSTIGELNDQITQGNVERDLMFQANVDLQAAITKRETALSAAKTQNANNKAIAQKYKKELEDYKKMQVEIKPDDNFANYLNDLFTIK